MKTEISNIASWLSQRGKVKVPDKAIIVNTIEVEAKEVFGRSIDELLGNGVQSQDLKEVLEPYFSSVGFNLVKVTYDDAIELIIDLPCGIAFSNQDEVEEALKTVDDHIWGLSITNQFQTFFGFDKATEHPQKFLQLLKAQELFNI